MWPVALMACSLASLAMLAWMSWFSHRCARLDQAAAKARARADLPRDVSPLSLERCARCTPPGRQARIALCPACALLDTVFPEDARKWRPGAEPETPSW